MQARRGTRAVCVYVCPAPSVVTLLNDYRPSVSRRGARDAVSVETCRFRIGVLVNCGENVIKWPLGLGIYEKRGLPVSGGVQPVSQSLSLIGFISEHPSDAFSLCRLS